MLFKRKALAGVNGWDHGGCTVLANLNEMQISRCISGTGLAAKILGVGKKTS